jgi:hypothetical protein
LVQFTLVEFANKVVLEDNTAVELEGHAAVALVQFTLVEFANKVVLAATNVLLHRLAVPFLICFQS